MTGYLADPRVFERNMAVVSDKGGATLLAAPADQSATVLRLPGAAPLRMIGRSGEWTFCSAPSGERGMGSEQIARGRFALRVKLVLAVITLAAAALSVCESAEPWSDRIRPAVPGPFPLVRPFSGEFRFGWSDIGAASAKARLWYSGDSIIVEIEGGTDGLARALWQLDARHKAVILKEGLKPVAFEQLEKYAKKRVRTEAVFKPDGLWRIRAVTPDPKNVAKWKRIKVEPVRDIISAMLFIRSQVLNDGDTIGVVAFPGDAPFLVEVTVAKHEQIRIAGVFARRSSLISRFSEST